VAEAEIGVIGSMTETSPLDGGEELLVDTPYGFPSSPICVLLASATTLPRAIENEWRLVA